MKKTGMFRLPVLSALAALAALSILAGCVADEDAPLPGERISIATLETGLQADEDLADMAVVLPEPWRNPDWPQPGGYANHAMQHLAAPGELEQIWSISAGAGSGLDRFLTAPPIISGGTVYVLDATAVVHAFDAETGDDLWEQPLAPEDEDADEGFGGGIAFYDGRLFATTGFGQLAALDATTGDILWVAERGIPFRAAPTADGGRVFAATYDNDMTAYAADDGRILWSHQGISESAGILQATSPAVSGTVVVAPFSSGEIIAVRVETGLELWGEQLTRTGTVTSLGELNDIAGRPVVDRERVFAVSHSGRMVSIDLLSGERVWTRDIDSIHTPWVAGDFIYVVTTAARIVCLTRDEGRIRWIANLPGYEDPEDREDPVEWAGPVLAGDRLLAVSSTGEMVSVSPYTGELLGRISIPGQGFLTPVVANDTLYLLTDNGDLAAYR